MAYTKQLNYDLFSIQERSQIVTVLGIPSKISGNKAYTEQIDSYCIYLENMGYISYNAMDIYGKCFYEYKFNNKNYFKFDLIDRNIISMIDISKCVIVSLPDKETVESNREDKPSIEFCKDYIRKDADTEINDYYSQFLDRYIEYAVCNKIPVYFNIKIPSIDRKYRLISVYFLNCNLYKIAQPEDNITYVLYNYDGKLKNLDEVIEFAKSIKNFGTVEIIDMDNDGNISYLYKYITKNDKVIIYNKGETIISNSTIGTIGISLSIGATVCTTNKCEICSLYSINKFTQTMTLKNGDTSLMELYRVSVKGD